MVMPTLINHTLGNYRLEQLLGRGGMGEVYAGANLMTGRRVAVKVLSAHLAADPAMRERMVREASALGHLDHPHIVRLYDCGLDSASGRVYLVMELVEGGSLRGQIERRRGTPLPVPLAVELVRQVATGLAYAHQTVIHRDIKPDNLLLQAPPPEQPGSVPQVKISDFGLARLKERAGGAYHTQGGLWLTPEYASPEQLAGRALDERSDLYSLGVVLFELLAGRVPFVVEAGDLAAAIQGHLHTPPPALAAFRSDLSPGLDVVVQRCLAKEPADRFSDAAQLATALAQLHADGAVGARPTVVAGPAPGPTLVRSDEGGRLVLRVVQADGSTYDVQLDKDGITIGRNSANIIVLDHARISRHHLRLRWDGREVQIEDLGSSNGTTLNGALLRRHVVQPWPWGQPVELSAYRLELRPPEHADAPAVLRIARPAGAGSVGPTLRAAPRNTTEPEKL